MKNYRIFQHPDGRMEAVKQGWSWPGFLFGMIWALIKKLWNVAIALGVVVAVMVLISFMLEPDPNSYSNYYEYNSAASSLYIWEMVTNLISLGIAIFLGVKGNSLRESNLLGRGYDFVGTASAKNPDLALAEYNQTVKNNQNNNDNSQNNNNSNNNGGSGSIVM